MKDISMQNMRFQNRTRISYIFLRLVGKLSEIDGKIRNYGTDQPLYNAEIHMIKSIKENEGIHVTGLADMLGVTKGAVSQITMKIERKGMIVKNTDPGNLSRLVLKLTPKGETAYIHHERLHQEFDAIFHAALVNASEENKQFLHDFLNLLDEKIDAFNNK